MHNQPNATSLPSFLLTVICPCFNEQEVIETFYQRLKKVLLDHQIDHEILFMDDGSQDRTLDILLEIDAKDPQVFVYSFTRNFGHQTALTAGIKMARGDAAIMMDTDMQHPPDLIPQLIQSWRQGYEVVSAVRKQTKKALFFKRTSSSLFYRVFNFLSDIPIPDGAADFCLLSKNAYQDLRKMPEVHRFLRGMITWLGHKRAYIEYSAPDRLAGQSKYSLYKMILLAGTAVFSFSSKPLRIATQLGIMITGLGFVYLFWIIGRYLFIRDLVPGWASVICVLLILGGIQLAFTGLIGQYIASVYEQVKCRPHYVFKHQPERAQTSDSNRKCSP